MSNASSGYRFGAMVKLEEVKIVLDDYWSDSDSRPFPVKEADAILKCLLSDYSVVKNALKILCLYNYVCGVNSVVIFL